MKLLIVLGIIFIINQSNSISVRVDPLVRISQGLLRGQIANDGDYSYFYGIPYAQVDEKNPFGPAQEAPSFGDEIFDAYEGAIRCPQMDSFASSAIKSDLEVIDCLRLNIYVPNQASTKNPLPVLVWIHGGLFATGYAGQFNPATLVKQGIIVVTINYRLGVYGFMCLDNPRVPGNQGLKDQYEALVWIRNNIASFGGNPYNVTVAGQSAGASSTLLQVFSAKPKLYNKVIIQSGCPQCEGMFAKGDIDAPVKLAQHLGFNTTDTNQALDFLIQTSPELISAAAVDLSLVLRPCTEKSFSGVDNFVETDPLSMSNPKQIKNTPILIGHNGAERARALELYGDNYFDSDPFYAKIKDNFNVDETDLFEIASIVRHYYIGDEPISKDLTLKFEEFDADFVVNHPIRRTITNLLKDNASPVYEYMFNYVDDKEATGAKHGDELSYLFDMALWTPYNKEEVQLIKDRITTLWANFVKYGNPTPAATDLLPVVWTPSSKDNRPYLLIDTDMQLGHRVYKERMTFWDLFYSVYANKHVLARDCAI